MIDLGGVKTNMTDLELDHDSDYGRLPIDHFLLEWWDHSSVSDSFPTFSKLPIEIKERIEDSRFALQVSRLTQVYVLGGLALRSNYLHQAKFNRENSVDLTADQVTLLQPLFTTQERLLQGQTVWRSPNRVMRTCYRSSSTHPQDQSRHQWLLDEYARWIGGICSDNRRNESGLNAEVFSDAERYSFGEQYAKIFQRCPDLLWEGNGWCDLDKRRKYLEGALAWVGKDSVVNPAELVLQVAENSVVNWLQVEDETFFNGRPVLLVYYDEFGRTCFTEEQGQKASLKDGKWVVEDYAAAGMTPALQSGAWFDGCWSDSVYDEQKLGATYREDGVIGKKWLEKARKLGYKW